MRAGRREEGCAILTSGHGMAVVLNSQQLCLAVQDLSSIKPVKIAVCMREGPLTLLPSRGIVTSWWLLKVGVSHYPSREVSMSL